MTRLNERIATNLKKARTSTGLTQQALATKARVSVGTVARYEQGRTTSPREDEFERIAAAVGCTTDDLRGIPDEPSDVPVEPGEDDTSVVRRNLEQRYGEDARFVQQVLDHLARAEPPQRTTVLRLLLGGIGDALGRPPLVRDPQLTR